MQVSSPPIVAGDEIPQKKGPAAGLTAKVIKGTLWTLIGASVPIFFSLFTTPVVTRLLGAEGYGLFVLVLLIPNYFIFADFGMNVASTKFASEAFAEGSPVREAQIVRNSALIALMSSLPLAAAMIVFSYPILRIFNVPDHLIGEASLCLKLAGVNFVVGFMNGIFNTPELTRLRMDLNITIASGGRLVGILATPVVIYLGGGVTGAVVAALAASLLTLIGHLVVSARLLPELAGFSLDRATFRPMLRFGFSVLIAFIAGSLILQLEKFVLVRVTSVEALGYYWVAAAFAGMLTMFSSSIAQSLMPAFSQLQSEDNRPALSALYSRGIRASLIWLVPAVVFMMLAGRPFFTYWFSPDFGRESTGPFYVIVIGLFCNVLGYFPYTAIMAAGRSDIFAKMYWAELLPYLLLLWWLTVMFGPIGTAAAWSLRAFSDAFLLFTLARRVGHVTYMHPNLPQFLAAVAVMVSPLTALLYFREINIQMVLISFAAAALYATIVFTRVLERDELAWLKSRITLYFPK